MSCYVILGELLLGLFIYLNGYIVDIPHSFDAAVLTNNGLHSITYFMILHYFLLFLEQSFLFFPFLFL